MSKCPSPVFVDPIYNGPADPMVIKNVQTGKFYMFYTQRRASTATEGSVAYCYGSKIGVAEAYDDGSYWYYRGALDLEFEFGDNTFWAPEIVWDEESALYHMYVTYIRGIHSHWAGNASIHHYISEDLFHWKHIGKLEIGSKRIIDPCLFKLPSGTWRMWYKDERSGAHTFYADSDDLYNWKDIGQATFDGAQEGPNVFEFGGKYWLIADEWRGLAIYSSDDLTVFTRQEGVNILCDVSNRPLDCAIGRHADVISCGEHAYIVYFVHYNDTMAGENPSNIEHAPTVVHIAELHITDGKLTCDRNEKFELNLK